MNEAENDNGYDTNDQSQDEGFIGVENEEEMKNVNEEDDKIDGSGEVVEKDEKNEGKNLNVGDENEKELKNSSGHDENEGEEEEKSFNSGGKFLLN